MVFLAVLLRHLHCDSSVCTTNVHAIFIKVCATCAATTDDVLEIFLVKWCAFYATNVHVILLKFVTFSDVIFEASVSSLFQIVCPNCGASSEPLPFNQMVYYVSASALV